jgi:hypothetical protein
MTGSQLLQGSLIFVAVIAVGALSINYVNRRFAGDNRSPMTTATPCIAADGTWRHWTHANVPMLSPTCEDGK